MRRGLQVILIIAAVCRVASAQYNREYVFVGAGGFTQAQDSAVSLNSKTQANYQAGGGIERLLDRGFGVLADAAGIVPSQGKTRDAVAGVASFDGIYHFRGESKADIVALGGYSLLFRDHVANLGNFGGGLHYWFQDTKGLLIEWRSTVGPTWMSSHTAHFWGIRFGLTFR